VIVLIVLLIGLYLFSAFADVHGQARTDLSVAIAVVTSLLVLLNRPALRPPASEAVPRASFVAFIGRLVIVLVWVVQAFIFGFSGYFVSSNFQEQPGFHGRVALLAAVGQALALVALCARSMAGFRPDRGFSSSVFGVLRFLLDRVILVVLAGYASTLPDLAETAAAWVPDHVHAFFLSLVPAWLAWPTTVAACAVWFFAVLVAESLLQLLIASVLGRENSLGSWLGDHVPVTYRRTASDVTFDFSFGLVRVFYYNSVRGWAYLVRVLLEVRGSSDFGPIAVGPTRRRRRRMQRLENPLTADESRRLRDRVAAAAVAAAPSPWRLLALEYRAVVGHEEIQLWVDPPARLARGWQSPADEEAAAGEPGTGPDSAGAGPVVLDAPGFPGLEALRRIREAGYSADGGVAYGMTVTVEKNDPSGNTHHGDGPWRIARWSTERDRMPAWRQPPRARQYRRDLRRFPTVRGRQPFWLRNEIKRLG
jgi:hypothetical protein